MEDRALPLNPEELAAALGTLDHERLCSARDEVGDDGVDGDAPAGDRDSCLARGYEDRADPPAARFEVELERDRHLPDRAVRADGQHDRARHLQVRAGCRGQIARGPPEIAQLDMVVRRECTELLVVAEEHVQAVLDVQSLSDAASKQLHPLRRKATSLRRDADERSVRVEAERVVDGLHDR